MGVGWTGDRRRDSGMSPGSSPLPDKAVTGVTGVTCCISWAFLRSAKPSQAVNGAVTGVTRLASGGVTFDPCAVTGVTSNPHETGSVTGVTAVTALSGTGED